jgi:thioredoxin reductase (NADPH)
MTFFSSSKLLELDDIPFVSILNKPKRNEALEYYRRVAEYRKVNINLFEKVLTVTSYNGTFSITSEKATYSSDYVIIATGFTTSQPIKY